MHLTCMSVHNLGERNGLKMAYFLSTRPKTRACVSAVCYATRPCVPCRFQRVASQAVTQPSIRACEAISKDTWAGTRVCGLAV